MPDAPGLELIAHEVNGRHDGAIVGTTFEHGQAALLADPEQIRTVIAYLKDAPGHEYRFLASVHGVDYLPEEPRLGVHYELLSMERADRLNVRTRLGIDDPHVPTVVDLHPTANFQEREVYDMFGVVFDGHPDMRRILMPEDYEGYPQRRDFPMGGEPVIYTYNEPKLPRWYD